MLEVVEHAVQVVRGLVGTAAVGQHAALGITGCGDALQRQLHVLVDPFARVVEGVDLGHDVGGVRLVVGHLDERDELVSRAHIALGEHEEQVLVLMGLGALGDVGIARVAGGRAHGVFQLRFLAGKLGQLAVERTVEELLLRVLVEQRFEVLQVALRHQPALGHFVAEEGEVDAAVGGATHELSHGIVDLAFSLFGDTQVDQHREGEVVGDALPRAELHNLAAVGGDGGAVLADDEALLQGGSVDVLAGVAFLVEHLQEERDAVPALCILILLVAELDLVHVLGLCLHQACQHGASSQ